MGDPKLFCVSHKHIRDVEDSRNVTSFAMVMKSLKVYMAEKQKDKSFFSNL
jgi:hypothetical protein